MAEKSASAERIDALIALVKGLPNGKLFFVPGDKDWDNSGVMTYSGGDQSNDRRHQIKFMGYYQITPEWLVGGTAMGVDALLNAADLLPASLYAIGVKAWALSPQRVFSTVTTNVPGPQFPLYCLGKEITQE